DCRVGRIDRLVLGGGDWNDATHVVAKPSPREAGQPRLGLLGRVIFQGVATPGVLTNTCDLSPILLCRLPARGGGTLAALRSLLGVFLCSKPIDSQVPTGDDSLDVERPRTVIHLIDGVG